MDYPTLFISNTTGYYSTRLTKVDKTTFKKNIMIILKVNALRMFSNGQEKNLFGLIREANGAYVIMLLLLIIIGKILYKRIMKHRNYNRK